jgi:hypothetical protein
MRLPGRLEANEAQVTVVPAFEIASKTESYCGMCNVPGYVYQGKKGGERGGRCRQRRSHQVRKRRIHVSPHAHAYIPIHAQRARGRARRLPGGGRLRQLDHAQQPEAVERVSE